MSRFARTTVVGKSLNINDVLDIEHSVKVQLKSKNLMNIYGYSASGINNVEYPRQLTNSYGTTISTTDISNSITVTQEILNTPSYVTDYKVGYFNIGVKNDFKTGDSVVLSFDLEIINNPLNVPNMSVMPNGGSNKNFPLNGNGRYSVPFTWAINTTYPERQTIEIRNAGCSCVFSNFQLELGEVATDYVPHEVEDFTGIEVTATGKNLLDLSSIVGTSTTANGGTLTCGEDGGITGSGTPTNSVAFYGIPVNVPKGDLTFSASGTFTNMSAVIYLRDAENTSLATIGVSLVKKVTFNLDSYPTFHHATLEIKRSKNNVEMTGTMYIQLEYGTEATEHESPKAPQVIASDSQGKVNGLKSYSPVMNLNSNSDDLIIECSYFPLSVRDINDSIKIQEMVDNTDLVVSTMNSHRTVVVGNPLQVNDLLDLEHVLQVQVMGKNLFDAIASTGHTVHSYYDVENGLIRSNAETQNEYCCVNITDLWHVLKATGKKITFSFDIKTETAGTVQFYTLGRYKINVSNNEFATTTEWQHKSFTVENTAFVYMENDTNGEKCGLSWYGTYDTGVNPYIRNLQIEVSDVETEYEPFCTDFTGKEVVVSGKNLIPFPYFHTSKTLNGITFTVNEDGSVHYEGTATANAQFHFTNPSDVLLTPGETYTFTVNADSKTTSYTSIVNVNYSHIDGTKKVWTGMSINDMEYLDSNNQHTSRTAVYPADGTGGIQAYIHIPSGGTVNNTVRFMIEVGTKATGYEPYKEPITATANIEGSVLGLRSVSPTMVITTDSGNLVKYGYFSESSEDVYAKYLNIKKAIKDAQGILNPEPLLTDIIQGQTDTLEAIGAILGEDVTVSVEPKTYISLENTLEDCLEQQSQIIDSINNYLGGAEN
jgi:hypothetical protein